MREICTLGAMWRGLETGLRQLLNGHEEGNLGYKPRRNLWATAPVLDPTRYHPDFERTRGTRQGREDRFDEHDPILLTCRNAHWAGLDMSSQVPDFRTRSGSGYEQYGEHRQRTAKLHKLSLG